jgi:two-component sensor histidine kinase
LVWQERGGPKVKAGRAKGFGTRLIDHVISHDLDGKTEADFDAAGVRWTITFLVNGLVEGQGPMFGSSIA